MKKIVRTNSAERKIRKNETFNLLKKTSNSLHICLDVATAISLLIWLGTKLDKRFEH